MGRRVFITKAQAVQIAGSKERLKKLAECMGRAKEERWVLFTGANLFQLKQGAVIRYGIAGFSQDGSDVGNVLKALTAGDQCLLFADQRRSTDKPSDEPLL